ncbi:MAG TPA: hypothetical protein VEX35_10960 [Allosphingosinicella sp.]|nr:hypothetical protein [Allosphingosinicella sp.]
MTPGLLFALAAAVQQTGSAEEAIAAQQAQVRAALRTDCPPAPEGEDIVVCGRGGERHRLRPLEPLTPGGAADRAGGLQRDALAADTSRCTTVGRDQDCGHVDMLGAGIMLIREIVRGIERRRD